MAIFTKGLRNEKSVKIKLNEKSNTITNTAVLERNYANGSASHSLW